MTFLNRHRSRIRPVGPFAPSSLFFGGIPGAWYDPTDLSTMFQDSAGTTPVTAVEQPVGLILDKSQGLALGAELVANGDFSNGSTGWTLGAGWSVAGGLATKAPGVASLIYRAAAGVVVGKMYRVQFTVSNYVAGSVRPFVGFGVTGTYVSGNGTFTQYIINAVNTTIGIDANATFDGSVTNISIRELAGNHASQSTAASRPTYRARYNLLTDSENFGPPWSVDNATVTTDTTIAPDGTLTADTLTPSGSLTAFANRVYRVPANLISGATYVVSVWAKSSVANAKMTLSIFNYGGQVFTLTSSWQRYSVSIVAGGTSPNTNIYAGEVNPTTGAIISTNVIQIWGAQLMTAADAAATGNAYQRIAAATVYDTAPVFRPYLAFDGMDDSLSTAAIDFTSTDKMTVFAGLTKSSGAALGMVTELGNRNIVQAGSFSLTAPRNAGAPDYSFIVEGTAVTDNTIVTYIAPITNVMTARGDIAASLNQLRVNGAVAGTLTTTLGTGNFGNWALNIGRRNNTNLPFNGRIYELIVRGAASSVTEIADTELWVNARTGAF